MVKLTRGFNEDYPLQQAKYNVERYYSVVGVLEDMNKTLTVLDAYVPRFFKGVKDVYWSECCALRVQTQNVKRRGMAFAMGST